MYAWIWIACLALLGLWLLLVEQHDDDGPGLA